MTQTTYILQQQGVDYPVESLATVRQWIASGNVTAIAKIKPAGSGEWQAVSAVPELAVTLKRYSMSDHACESCRKKKGLSVGRICSEGHFTCNECACGFEGCNRCVTMLVSVSGAIQKLKEMNLPWVVTLSIDDDVDGINPSNYRATITCQTPAGFDVAIAQNGDEDGRCDISSPWTASILIRKSFPDDGSSDRILASVYEYDEDDRDEFRRITKFVSDVTLSARQARVKRLLEARAAFFS